MKPLIVINLKTYHSGKAALALAKKIQAVNKNIILGAQPTDISLLKNNTKLKIYAQHIDNCTPGRNTGFITPESVKIAGAEGVFLNHSEHKLYFKTIKETTALCKKIGLKTLIFAKDTTEAKKIEKLKPDYIAIEPPELVAGKKSVSTEKPELIKKIKKTLKSKFLVGAGIKTNTDVKIAMKLGASGIAISSAITKAKNPKAVLKSLIK